MIYDIYLGGVSSNSWREEFKKKMPSQFKIADPFVENFFNETKAQQTDHIAKDFFLMDNSKLAVFYFDDSEKGQASRLKLGDMVGRGKQVVTCITDSTVGKEFLETYCNYRGISISKSIDELIKLILEIIEQTTLSK